MASYRSYRGGSDHHNKSYPGSSVSNSGHYQQSFSKSYGSDRSHVLRHRNSDKLSQSQRLSSNRDSDEHLAYVASQDNGLKSSPRALLPLAPPPGTKVELLLYQHPLVQRYRWGTESMSSNYSDYKKFLTWRRLWLYLAKAQRVSYHFDSFTLWLPTDFLTLQHWSTLFFLLQSVKNFCPLRRFKRMF